MGANHLGSAITADSPLVWSMCASTGDFASFTSGLSPGTGVTLPRHNVAGGKWQASMKGTFTHASIPSSSDMTVEMVLNSTESAYNFFGGPYSHAIISGTGYLWSWNISVAPSNGAYTDTSGVVQFQTWDVSNNYQIVVCPSTSVITNGMNTHVAIVNLSSGSTSIYINGSLAASGTSSRRGAISANAMSVGDDGTYGSLCYRDYVSHLAVYTKDLGAQSIAARAALVQMPTYGSLAYSGSNWSDARYSKDYVSGSGWKQYNPKFYGGSAWVQA